MAFPWSSRGASRSSTGVRCLIDLLLRAVQLAFSGIGRHLLGYLVALGSIWFAGGVGGQLEGH